MNEDQVEILMRLLKSGEGISSKFLNKIYGNENIATLIEAGWISVLGPDEWYCIRNEKMKELFAGILELQ